MWLSVSVPGYLSVCQSVCVSAGNGPCTTCECARCACVVSADKSKGEWGVSFKGVCAALRKA